MEQERKLLFFDIDGTLLMPGEDLSPVVVQAIRTARRKGHLVFLGTGRTESDVPERIRDIGWDGGIFSAGGRVVVHGQEIHSAVMNDHMARQVMEILNREEGLLYNLECRSGTFRGNVEDLDAAAMDQERFSSELRRLLQAMLENSRRTVAEYDGEPIYKIGFFCFTRAQMDEVERSLAPLGKVVRFDNAFPDVPLSAGEITDQGTDKGRALLAVCKYCGVSVSQSVAFGDSMNDTEMLEAAGIGVAMGNAEPEVKALADRICESCSEDGVARELERLGLV